MESLASPDSAQSVSLDIDASTQPEEAVGKVGAPKVEQYSFSVSCFPFAGAPAGRSTSRVARKTTRVALQVCSRMEPAVDTFLRPDCILVWSRHSFVPVSRHVLLFHCLGSHVSWQWL